MGLRDVDRAQAEQLGLLEPGEALTPPEQPVLNDSLEADISGMEPDLVNQLLTALGNLVELDGSVLKWIGAV